MAHPSVEINRPTRTLVYYLAIVGILATAYTIWPIVSQGPAAQFCRVWADASFTSAGFRYALGPPLFAWPQFVLEPGRIGYINATYHSSANPVGFMLKQFYGQRGMVAAGLWKIDELTGDVDFVSENETAAIVFVSAMSFQGDHSATITSVVVAKNETLSGVYMMSFPSTCWNPLSTNYQDAVLTVGLWPYLGPLPGGTIQPGALLMNLALFEVFALIAIFAADTLREKIRKKSDKLLLGSFAPGS